jgi:predicted ArsR family transcriptional regulator
VLWKAVRCRWTAGWRPRPGRRRPLTTGARGTASRPCCSSTARRPRPSSPGGWASRRPPSAGTSTRPVATGRVEERHAPGTPRGRGRPARLFHLTDAGRSAFPHAYDDLALTALRFVATQGGPDAVRAVAEAQLAGLEQRCSAAVEAAPGAPVDRARALAAALTAEGYAASASAISGGGQLCQHHCPVAHVAAEFPQLCEAETAVIGRLVGTHVQRLATIAHGDGVCTTHIPGPVRRASGGDHARAGNRSGSARPVPDERAAHRLQSGARPAPSTSSTPTNDRERTPA